MHKIFESAAMIVMAVTEDYFLRFAQVDIEQAGVVYKFTALSGIKEKACAFGCVSRIADFNKERETVFILERQIFA